MNDVNNQLSDFNVEAFRGFFQRNSSSDTKTLTIQLIKLCTVEKQKSKRELYRLYLEFKNSATQAKHHVSELHSFVTKSVASVSQSLSGFSQDGLRATMVASGLFWALTNDLVSVKALQFVKVVEDAYENTNASTPAVSLPVPLVSVPSSRGTGEAVSISQPLPVPKSRESSVSCTGVSGGSVTSNQIDVLEDHDDPEPVSLQADCDPTLDNINMEIAKINQSLAENWLCATGTNGEGCGDVFVESVVAYFTRKLNAVSDNAKKIHILKSLIAGALSSSSNAKRFVDNSATMGQERVLQRGISLAKDLLRDLCRNNIAVQLMPQEAMKLRHEEKICASLLTSPQALHLIFSAPVPISSSYPNTRARAPP